MSEFQKYNSNNNNYFDTNSNNNIYYDTNGNNNNNNDDPIKPARKLFRPYCLEDPPEQKPLLPTEEKPLLGGYMSPEQKPLLPTEEKPLLGGYMSPEQKPPALGYGDHSPHSWWFPPPLDLSKQHQHKMEFKVFKKKIFIYYIFQNIFSKYRLK